jgi:hypothetical protein
MAEVEPHSAICSRKVRNQYVQYALPFGTGLLFSRTWQKVVDSAGLKPSGPERTNGNVRNGSCYCEIPVWSFGIIRAVGQHPGGDCELWVFAKMGNRPWTTQTTHILW